MNNEILGLLLLSPLVWLVLSVMAMEVFRPLEARAGVNVGMFLTLALWGIYILVRGF